MKKLPAMTGIQSVVAVEYPSRIGRDNFTMTLIAPSDFLSALLPGGDKAATVSVAVPGTDTGKELKSLEVTLVEKAPPPDGARIRKKAGNPPASEPYAGPRRNLEVMLDIPVEVTAELGRAKVPVANIMNLAAGSVVGLDIVNGKPIRVLVNDRCVAMGQVVTIGEKFGVRIVGLVEPEKRLEEL